MQFGVSVKGKGVALSLGYNNEILVITSSGNLIFEAKRIAQG